MSCPPVHWGFLTTAFMCVCVECVCVCVCVYACVETDYIPMGVGGRADVFAKFIRDGLGRDL